MLRSNLPAIGQPNHIPQNVQDTLFYLFLSSAYWYMTLACFHFICFITFSSRVPNRMRHFDDLGYRYIFWPLTFFKKSIHVLAGLVIVDANFKAQVFKALEQLSSITICAIAYIHPLNTDHKVSSISLTEHQHSSSIFHKTFNNSHITETMKINYETMVYI